MITIVIILSHGKSITSGYIDVNCIISQYLFIIGYVSRKLFVFGEKMILKGSGVQEDCSMDQQRSSEKTAAYRCLIRFI